MGKRLKQFRLLNTYASQLEMGVASRLKLLLSSYLHRLRVRLPFLPLPTLRVRFQSGGRPVAAFLRANDVDYRVLVNLFVKREYEVPVEGVRRILDLGGNIGMADVAFHARYPEAEFVTVEPVPDNVRMIRRNWEANGIRGRIVQAAASNREGTTEFFVGGPDNSSLCRQPWMSGQSMEVRCVTVPQLLREAGWDRVDVLKVDIEGGERDLFRDCGGWIGSVGTIVGELHDGYTVEAFSEDLGGRFECRKVFAYAQLQGVLATRRR